MTATPEGQSDGTGEAGRHQTSPPVPGMDGASARLAQALQRAGAALLWEQAWPALALVLAVGGLFLIVSWLGLWLVVPPWARMVGLAGFAILFVVALIPALRIRPPARDEALTRLDHASGLAHRPVTALADHLASRPEDPVAAALWRAHLSRVSSQLGALRAGMPSPRLAARDPRAFRALVLLGVIATYFMVPGDHLRRIATAFDWQAAVAPKPYRIDAWVTPPAYTGRPPIILPGLRSDEPRETAAAAPITPDHGATAMSVPAGSELVVRVTGLDMAPLAIAGGIAEAKPEAESAPAASSGAGDAPKPAADSAAKAASKPAISGEQHFIITGDGTAQINGPDGRSHSWQFSAVPDTPPTITLAKEPGASGRTGLVLSYKMEDDYGVVSAEAKFTAVAPPAPLFALKNAKPRPSARPLVEAPDFPLPLPGGRTRSGASQTTKDLTESPWAGTRVMLTLVARDDAGNIGSTVPKSLVLPARAFNNPLALALIEQRRLLAFDANERGQVLAALAALSIAPERFTPDPAHYLGLRSAYFRLDNAQSDEDLRGVVDYLWEVAVRIEDGDISDVEKKLRDAQQALQDALENGASDQEIQRLAQELRKAMEDYMKALAQDAQRNDQSADAPPDPNVRTLRPQDLTNMLDNIEKLARNGARDAARQMLSDLQNMLNGLQAGRQQQRRGGQGQMSQALNELGDMIRRQQRLRDQTFQQGQNGQQDKQGQKGQPGEQGEQGQSFSDLQRNQEQLREQLRQLRDKMQAMRNKGQQGQQGQQPGEQGQQGQGQQGQGGPGESGLSEAEQAMREAEQALRNGDGTGAVDAQSEALQALRQGAQQMAEAMQQEGGQEGGPGSPSGQQAERTDPLGRPLRSRDYGDDTTVKVPDEMDQQRARQVLEELRRRFADPQRPQIELDYLERLLRDF